MPCVHSTYGNGFSLLGFFQDAQDLLFSMVILYGSSGRISPRTLTHSTPVSGEGRSRRCQSAREIMITGNGLGLLTCNGYIYRDHFQQYGLHPLLKRVKLLRALSAACFVRPQATPLCG